MTQGIKTERMHLFGFGVIKPSPRADGERRAMLRTNGPEVLVGQALPAKADLQRLLLLPLARQEKAAKFSCKRDSS